MKTRRSRLLLSMLVLALVPLFGPAATMQPAPKRPVQIEDVIAWKTLGASVLSADGQWFGYRLTPQEGDARRRPEAGPRRPRAAIHGGRAAAG